jgi:hypothetical protein
MYLLFVGLFGWLTIAEWDLSLSLIDDSSTHLTRRYEGDKNRNGGDDANVS